MTSKARRPTFEKTISDVARCALGACSRGSQRSRHWMSFSGNLKKRRWELPSEQFAAHSHLLMQASWLEPERDAAPSRPTNRLSASRKARTI